MSLIKMPFLEKKQENEYFLCLILRNEIAKAIIFEKIGTSIKYINDGQEYFTDTIEDASVEELLDTLDKAIGKAESTLPQNIQTHKTLFALKESWIIDNKIKKEYLDKLKKAIDELALEPIGFLVFSESIINLIHKEEGAPVTAILVEIGKKYVTVSLIRAGKILEVRSSEMLESYPSTVDVILKHFETAEVLPSRIIIFANANKDLQQEFASFKWSKSLPFLHIPQIASLSSDNDVKAVLLGAATQMGAEMIFEGKKTEPTEETVTTEDVQEEELPTQDLQETNADTKTEDLEFVEKDSSLDFFGFVQGADVAKTQVIKSEAVIASSVLEEQTEQLPEEEKIDIEQKENIGSLGVSTASKAKNFLTKLPVYFRKTNFTTIPLLNLLKGKKLIIIPIILILAFIFLFLIIASASRAKITIFVIPKTEEKTESITFSPKSATNLDEKILSVEIIPIDETGSTTINTTGKKDVGAKAKGSVTIFNNDAETVNLSSGTTLASSNGQKFILDASVKVASASGDIFSGTKPGTANANITAVEIGTDSNLPSDTKFTVGTSKTIAAKNDNALSGGTKKVITVVSKDDLITLEENLPKSLSDKAKNEIKNKINEEKTIIPTFANIDISNETFDRKVDEEANQVSINATVSFNYIAYANNDIESLAQKLFNNQNFTIRKNKLSVDAKNIKVNKNKDITADLHIKANLYPKIDTKDLAKKIAGESVQKTQNQLGNLENVSSVEIVISPNFPFISANLPKNPNNITITTD